MLFASVGVVACLVTASLNTGMELSKDNRSWRQYYSVFGWRVGRWKPLPVIVGVTVKYFAEMRRSNTGSSNWGVWKDSSPREEKLVVMLSVEHEPVGIVLGHFPLGRMEQALTFAQHTAEKSDVPVHTFLPDGLA